MVSVEIAANTVARLLIVGTNNSTNLKAGVKARASRNHSVTEISESDANKQAEETWSPNTSSATVKFVSRDRGRRNWTCQ